MENSTLDHILDRRSIRRYQRREVSDELLKMLLQAGMNAPSACNQQCWHFVIIRDTIILDELSRIHGGYHTLKNSPVAILICYEPDTAKLECFLNQDCAAATENILIAANSLGLGALWMGVNPTTKGDSDIIRRCLHIPENIVPFSFVSVGYPSETPAPQNKFDESKIHDHSSWS